MVKIRSRPAQNVPYSTVENPADTNQETPCSLPKTHVFFRQKYTYECFRTTNTKFSPANPTTCCAFDRDRIKGMRFVTPSDTAALRDQFFREERVFSSDQAQRLVETQIMFTNEGQVEQ